MSMRKKCMALLLAVCLLAGLLTGCGPAEGTKPSEPGGNTEKTVEAVEVTKTPAKTEYSVGETFSAEGGEISITYSDGTTETKSMTDSAVTISEVNTTINDESQNTATKTVTVRFGGKSARFDITVSHVLLEVTFDLGYDGASGDAQTVRKDGKAERPADPTRESFRFDNWYSDPGHTSVFDFDTPITENTTVYANWMEDATYYEVSFALNYAGAVDPSVQKIKEGETAGKPANDPQRKGYAFDGWYADEAGTTPFDFAAAVNGNTTAYAKWTKTVSGRNWYTFEAEDTNLNGKSGPGLSGTAGGPGMIQLASGLGASNDRFIGYQYEVGCSLEFQFNSDVAVEDATIVIRLSAELRDFDIDPESYKMSLNGVDLDYKKISFTNVPKGSSDDVGTVNALPFEDYTIVTKAKLKEGMNVFSVTTTNDDAMSGTTMLSKAPLVDCIKIETEAVLDWAAQLGLPKDNY